MNAEPYSALHAWIDDIMETCVRNTPDVQVARKLEKVRRFPPEIHRWCADHKISYEIHAHFAANELVVEWHIDPMDFILFKLRWY
jgi:hypothetical protein